MKTKPMEGNNKDHSRVNGISMRKINRQGILFLWKKIYNTDKLLPKWRKNKRDINRQYQV
jgi:hypothetical protein